MTRPEGRLLPIEDVLLCVTGSIGVAYLPAVLTALLAIEPHLRFRSAFTAQAAQMLPPPTIAAITGGPAWTTWADAPTHLVSHAELTRGAELVLVIPATANALGKAASGIADDLVTTSLLAATCPVVFVPSMNPVMWTKPSVQRNVQTLRDDGCWVLEPAAGPAVSTGGIGVGSIPPVQDLLRLLAQIFHSDLEKA